MENENMQRLNQISSTVTERDMKIWENVAHSVLIQKETEKLKLEIARMKSATAEKKKENEIIEIQLTELTKTLTIQEQTLKTSQQSVVALTAHRESLQRDANDLKKKYAATLEMYNNVYQEYRGIYENTSQSYKDLKTQQTEMKKLEIKKMMFDSKISNLIKSQQQYKTIQEQIFHKTMVRFAKFYVLYHQHEKLQLEVQEKKKEEQRLLKEHLRLADAVKQKKQMYRNKPRTGPHLTNHGKPLATTSEPVKESKEVTFDKLQQFLSEDFKPCSLTSLDSSQKGTNSNKDSTKVQILDVKMIRPPPRPLLGNKSNPELRKKMENIVQAAKFEARRCKSPQIMNQKITPMGSQSSQPSSQTKIMGSQSQTGSQTKIKPQVSQQFSKPASQESKNGDPLQGSQGKESCEPPMKIPRMTPTAASSGEIKTLTPKEIATGSILKPASQVNVDKPEPKRPQNVSKFFNSQKKSVKFQSQVENLQPQDGIRKFQLFSMEARKTEPGGVVNNLDIFQKPIFFKNEASQKHDNENKSMVFPMVQETEEDASGSNASFTMETAPTMLNTFPGDLCENKTNELTFDLETSFAPSFGQPPLKPTEDFAATTENTTFNFFGSQSKANNIFGFF